MAVGHLTGLWRRTADFSIRHARAILVVAAVVTLGLGSAMFEIETDTDLNGFIRPEARELADEIEAHFDEGGQLNLIFESRSDRSLLEPELLHKQLRIIQALKERYRVTTFSLVEGIDAGLKRVKRKSLLDYDEYTPDRRRYPGAGRGAHGSRSREGEPPHGLAPGGDLLLREAPHRLGHGRDHGGSGGSGDHLRDSLRQGHEGVRPAGLRLLRRGEEADPG